jgi:hypothetical protein
MFNIFKKEEKSLNGLKLYGTSTTHFNVSLDLDEYYIQKIKIHPGNQEMCDWHVIKKMRKSPQLGDIFVVSLFEGEYIWGKVVYSIPYRKLNGYWHKSLGDKSLFQVILYDITTLNYKKIPDNWDQRKVMYRITCGDVYWSKGYAFTIDNQQLEVQDESNAAISFLSDPKNMHNCDTFPRSHIFTRSRWGLKNCDWQHIEHIKNWEHPCVTLRLKL